MPQDQFERTVRQEQQEAPAEKGTPQRDTADAAGETPESAGEETAQQAASEDGGAAEGQEDGQPKIVPKLIPDEEADYEALFLKDAKQRAHDAELAALASLALIRSSRGERDHMLFDVERDLGISTRITGRHLREIDRKAAAALLSDSDDKKGGKR